MLYNDLFYNVPTSKHLEPFYAFILQAFTISVTPTKGNLDSFRGAKTNFLELIIQQSSCFTQKGAPQLRGLRNEDLKCAELHAKMENS